MAEAMMRLLSHQLEAGLLVDVTSRDENAVGPEHHLLIPSAARETNTLLDQTGAKSQTARARLDQQETQFGNRLVVLHDKDRTDNLPLHLRNPAALPFGTIIVDKIRNDPGNQRLKTFVPP